MLGHFSQFVRWDTVSITIAIAILVVLELLGVFNDRYVTITYLVRTFIPLPARAAIIGWMWYHFMQTPPPTKEN